MTPEELEQQAITFAKSNRCQQQPKSDPLHHLNIDPLFIKVFH